MINRQPKTLLWLVILCRLFSPAASRAQTTKPENSMLWEISGKGLTAPSYLFGTFHLLTSGQLSQWPRVSEKLKASRVVAGEIVMDSTVMAKLLPASLMKDSTLTQLLSPEDYQLVAAYTREVTGMDIIAFVSFKPMALQAFLMQFEWTKQHPEDANGTPMDVHFQQQARREGKSVVGLETVEDQIHALFDQFTLQRQAVLLMQWVKNKARNAEELQQMTHCYRQQDLNCLNKLTNENSDYNPAEMQQLLTQRNARWMAQIPALIARQPTFIAIGAGHLTGDTGLIRLLRQQGYTVKALSVR